MKSIFLMIVQILICFHLYGQGENNYCTVFPTTGASGKIVIDFNQTPPQLAYAPNPTFGAPGNMLRTNVCSPSGQYLFTVMMNHNTALINTPDVFNASGLPVANSNFQTGYISDDCRPVVIPHPGNPAQYYIFYSANNALLFSLLDISLNGGNGGIVQKDVFLTPYGSVSIRRMVAVKGCNGVWLVVRSRIENGYYSFHVNSGGIDTQKVYSPTGSFTMYDYNISLGGFLKASPDGKTLAFAGWPGLELYDFEQCSGKVKNARVLETTGNLNPSPLTIEVMTHHTRYQDVCFSPDASKLYTTFNRVNSLGAPGELYQYNLDAMTLPAILASKTLLLTNYPSLVKDISLQCTAVLQNPLGEMKLARDGNIYIDNGSITCRNPGTTPPGFNPGAGFHVIRFPNLPGAAASVERNVITIDPFIGYPEADFFLSSSNGGLSYLQPEIVTAGTPSDTVIGRVFYRNACFTDSLLLSADSSGSCYRWDDGSVERARYVKHSGAYFVSYFKNCSYLTDTFKVLLVKIPHLQSRPSCENGITGQLAALPHDSSNLEYIWRQADSSIFRHSGPKRQGDTTSYLAPGNYLLELRTMSGCDTFLPVKIDSLPAPPIKVFPQDTTIRIGDQLSVHASGGLYYTWSPTSILDTPVGMTVRAYPRQPVIISVIGIGQFGCTDTAYCKINVDLSTRELIPNAFSPNGDGINDVFRVENISFQKIQTFNVFNRYGQRVYQSSATNEGWDGKQNSVTCDPGTYFYIIVIEYPDGTRRTFRGDVTLIR